MWCWHWEGFGVVFVELCRGDVEGWRIDEIMCNLQDARVAGGSLQVGRFGYAVWCMFSWLMEIVYRRVRSQRWPAVCLGSIKRADIVHDDKSLWTHLKVKKSHLPSLNTGIYKKATVRYQNLSTRVFAPSAIPKSADAEVTLKMRCEVGSRKKQPTKAKPKDISNNPKAPVMNNNVFQNTCEAKIHKRKDLTLKCQSVSNSCLIFS